VFATAAIRNGGNLEDFLVFSFPLCKMRVTILINSKGLWDCHKEKEMSKQAGINVSLIFCRA